MGEMDRILAQLLTSINMTWIIFNAGYTGVSEPGTVFSGEKFHSVCQKP